MRFRFTLNEEEHLCPVHQLCEATAQHSIYKTSSTMFNGYILLFNRSQEKSQPHHTRGKANRERAHGVSTRWSGSMMCVNVQR